MKAKSKTSVKTDKAKTKSSRTSTRKQGNDQLLYLASLVDNISDALISTDMDLNILEWNPAAENMYGWSAAEVTGHPLQDFIQSEYTDDATREQDIKAVMAGKVWKGEVIQKRRDGTRFPVMVSVSPVSDKTGKPIGLVAINRDITERKRAEERLILSETRYRRLFESAKDGILILDAETGLIVDANPFLITLLGYSHEAFLGKNIWELGFFKDIVANMLNFLELQKKEYIRYEDLPLETASGRRINVEFVSNVYHVDHHKVIQCNIRDITERKRAEAQIAYQARLLENVNDAVVATDAQFNVTSWNHAAEEMYGYRADEVLGRKAQEIIRSEFSEAQRAAAIKSLDETGFYRMEILQYHRDDHSFWVEGGTFALKDSNGLTYAYVSINRHITERKQAEAQIERQLQRLNALHTIDMAISSSFDLRVTLDVVLQQVLAQLGVDAAAILLFNPEMQTLEYAASRGFRSEALNFTRLKPGEGYAGRVMLERKTMHVSNLLQSGGKLARALHLENEFFVEYYGAPLIVKGEVEGVLEIYHRSPLRADAERQEFLETLAGQAAIAIDNAQLFDGLQRANAGLEGRVAKRTEELNRLNIELEHASRAKDEFLAGMSHELRTPLNSILGFSETLLEQRRGPLNEKQEQALQLISSSGQHLLSLINDILDVSKIEAGKLEIHPDRISIKEVCESSLNFIREFALKKSIGLEFQLEASLTTLEADPQRLKQILVNLLNNAVKFTPENGKVLLEVHTNEEKDQLHFSVSDTGIGIAPSDLRKLFTPFTQLDSSLSRQYEGTGLGLVLVYKFTELHGGSVQVESEIGKGSRFTIVLPWSRNIKTEQDASEGIFKSAEDSKNAPLPSGERGIILLAEDNASNILAVNEYLQDHGYTVVVAQNGLEALEKAEETGPGVILMDIQMPVMDGLEAIRRLRAIPGFSSTPIIALTALAMPGDREMCLEAGASEYISKPASLKMLVKTISKLLGNEE